MQWFQHIHPLFISDFKGFIMKKIFIAIIITMLFIPLGCIFTLKQKSHLWGVEEEVLFPKFSLEHILDTSCQNQFEKWFQHNFFLRNSLIKVRNQIYAWTNFNSFFYGNTIIRGTEEYLFEKAYLELRNPNLQLPKEQIQLIKEIAHECKNKNINFYFIIAPNKVTSYPEYLSPLYTFFYKDNPNYAKEIENIFIENNIPVYNAQELMFQLKENNELPAFNKTGTHWNFYGAGRTVQESFNYFNIAAINKIKIETSKNAYWAEMDLSRLLNLRIHYKTNENYYKPTFATAHPINTDTVIIGNSFSNEYTQIITPSNLINDPTLLQQYENTPLTAEECKKIWEVKNIFLIYTVNSIYSSTSQLYKKIQMLLDNKPQKI